jgi:phosphoribosylcarboxyaminoimidazole (NCAIR) mutase
VAAARAAVVMVGVAGTVSAALPVLVASATEVAVTVADSEDVLVEGAV